MIVRRIEPAHDLKKELLKIRDEIRSGVIVAGVGSLKKATLRLARENIVEFLGFFEIVSMQGTITLDGIHVHLAIANWDGKMIGGHLKGGCEVHTTVEVAILPYKGILRRSKDERTDFMELNVIG